MELLRKQWNYGNNVVNKYAGRNYQHEKKHQHVMLGVQHEVISRATVT